MPRILKLEDYYLVKGINTPLHTHSNLIGRLIAYRYPKTVYPKESAKLYYLVEFEMDIRGHKGIGGEEVKDSYKIFLGRTGMNYHCWWVHRNDIIKKLSKREMTLRRI